jgi:GTPase
MCPAIDGSLSKQGRIFLSKTSLGWLPADIEKIDDHARDLNTAVVLHPWQRGTARLDMDRTPENKLAEAVGLAEAISLDVRASRAILLRERKAATLFGPGQVQELAPLIAEADAGVVIVNGVLSPAQQRNLEKAWKSKVIDRTGLILEIFGDRARTREGMLQVELAHLSYQQSRLVKSWTHLERQRGGFGFLGGPGETQIETDRRLIRGRIAKLKIELEGVSRTRGLHRKQRKKAPHPVVAFVGYTNAGKSSLFNKLSGAEVLAKDMLFATLDPTLRGLDLPGVGRVIVSDTVGFISDLPTQLVAAFKATLEEVMEADLLLHVRDIAHPETDAQRKDVIAILAELGIDENKGPKIVEVLNKIDLLDDETRQAVSAKAARDGAIPISALTGEGTEALLQNLDRILHETSRTHEITLDPGDGKRLAWLHSHGDVMGMEHAEDALVVSVRLAPDMLARFEAMQR